MLGRHVELCCLPPYLQCKKGVWPPSDWSPASAERSAQLPDIRLKLEFCYGYDGMQVRQGRGELAGK